MHIGLALLVATALLAACASPVRLVQQWQDPQFKGGPFTRILVMGVTKDATLRRVFEDELSSQLRTRNVAAVPSYTLLPEDGPAPRERLERAEREAQADAVILARVLRVERRTEVVPMAPQPVFPGFYGSYGAAWGGPLWIGYAQPPAVFQFDQVYVETRLLDARADRLVWSSVGEVFAPGRPQEDAARFARVILDALAARGLI